MRWLSWMCAGMVAACAPFEPAEPGVLRQANFATTPDVTGPAASALGQSLALCPGGGYAAGAPGVGNVFLSNPGAMLPSVAAGVGVAVSCDGALGARRIVAGGPQGLFFFSDAGWQPINNHATLSIARSELTGALPLVVGQQPATVLFLNATTLVPTSATLDAGGPPQALAWFPDRARFVVGTPGLRRVQLFNFLSDGGVEGVRQLSDTAVAEFGRAVAVGDVSPRAGTELIVGGAGFVFVFAEDGTPLLKLSGMDGDPSFGAALVVERGHVMTNEVLDAVWVGEPASDRIYSFLGDAGTPFPSPNPGTNLSFGKSLTIDLQRRLSVGAPGYASQAGAVFSQNLGNATPVGTVKECSVGRPCFTPTCEEGECIGGVFCSTGAPLEACLFPETCNGAGSCITEDGGLRDPGLIDAGLPPVFDGGATVRDAGPDPLDAGSPLIRDGGPEPIDAGTQPVDAGTKPGDAGVTPVVDAGSKPDVDAGTSDAGTSDAGSPDAGSQAPVRFTTSSCASVSTGPLLLLALALTRRRR